MTDDRNDIRIMKYLMRTYRRTGTQRVSGFVLSSCHPSSSSDGLILLRQHLQTLLDLSGITLYDDVAA